MNFQESSLTRSRGCLLAICALGLVLSNQPHIFGWLSAPDGVSYSGTLSSNLDQLSYYAKMRQGLEGNWTYQNRYTPEPSRRVPLFAFYVTLGNISRWLNTPIIPTYHAARIANSILLLFALLRLTRRLGFSPPQRILAMALIIFGGGVGWMDIAGGAQTQIENRPIEYWLIEAFTFQSMTYYPHFTFTTALIVLILSELPLLGKHTARLNQSLLIIALSSFLIAWSHPRLLLLLMIVGFVFAARQAAAGTFPRKDLGLAMLAFLAAAIPPSLFILISINGDDIWAATSSPTMLTPSPARLVLGFGPLIIGAIAGASLIRRKPSETTSLLLAWLGGGLIAAYFPIDTQRRLLQGVTIPMACLTTIAMDRFLIRRWTLFAFTLLFSLSTVAFLIRENRKLARVPYPIFWPEERIEAMNFLSQETRDDSVVLGSIYSGVLIPPLANRTTSLGHWAETYQSGKKQRLLEEFFNSQTTPSRRNEICEAWGVSHLVYSDYEKNLGDFRPENDPGRWLAVWGEGTLKVFQRIQNDDE